MMTLVRTFLTILAEFFRRKCLLRDFILTHVHFSEFNSTHLQFFFKLKLFSKLAIMRMISVVANGSVKLANSKNPGKTQEMKVKRW